MNDPMLRDLDLTIEDAFAMQAAVLNDMEATPAVRAVGTIIEAGYGTVRVEGLVGVRDEELLAFPEGVMGMAFNIDAHETGVILMGAGDKLWAGAEVRRTNQVLNVPVGDALQGRVLSALGEPLDGKGPVTGEARLPVERPAWPIMDRAPVEVPLQTGLKVVDALIPVGRGQRELILGDRQTGKTAIALDTIINQKDKNVVCVYCGVGKRGSAAAKLIADLERHGALAYTVVVLATEEDPPGLQFIAPYAATSIGEYFMERGRDALVVYDDLTRHARAYRELSLLLRRPPGREAYPGDIFYVHSRLLERATHLRDEHGGGSLTALPIIETEAQNLSAYIPTNLISITDGQIYLSPDLFQRGVLPPVDVGKSVSRVGGKTQLPAYRAVAGDLRLSYSQFVELESFARFGTRLDPETQKTLARGRRVREVLKQPQYAPLPAWEQIVALVIVNEGVLDDLPLAAVAEAIVAIRREAADRLDHLREKIDAGEKLSKDDISAIVEAGRGVADQRRRDGRKGRNRHADD